MWWDAIAHRKHCRWTSLASSSVILGVLLAFLHSQDGCYTLQASNPCSKKGEQDSGQKCLCQVTLSLIYQESNNLHRSSTSRLLYLIGRNVITWLCLVAKESGTWEYLTSTSAFWTKLACCQWEESEYWVAMNTFWHNNQTISIGNTPFKIFGKISLVHCILLLTQWFYVWF